MRVALFLGAGASVFAGMPTTKEFLKMNRYGMIGLPPGADSGDRDVWQFIANILESNYIDIEELYDGVERAIAVCEGWNCRPIYEQLAEIRNCRPIYEQLVKCNNMDRATVADALKRLRNDIRERVRWSYEHGYRGTIERHDGEDLRYMIGGVAGEDAVYDPIWGVMKWAGADKFEVFTTNYDCVMELYAEIKHVVPCQRLHTAPAGRQCLDR